MGISSYSFLQRAHKVETPHHEWPRDWDQLESVSREMGVFGIELTPMA